MSAFQKLGRYLILEEIAKGGMAVIFRGKLLGVAGFEKEVAIKKILPFWSQNEEFISMLIDEAKILVQLHHPNIVQVIELGKEDESYFIVMEFVNGFDLRSLMRNLQKINLKLPLEFITYITKQICLGLDFAHNKKLNNNELKLVHRDISPQNILIGKEGEVKVTDFGIAKTTQKTTQTQTGVLKGKFSYMSPEQALGENIDHQTDIFALGILFYEMLFDVKCFDGKNDFEIIEKVKRAEILYPDDLADELRVILEKSLAVDKTKRYQNIIDFYHDLEKLESTFEKKVYTRDFCNFLHAHFANHFAKTLETPHQASEAATQIQKSTDLSYKVLTAVTELNGKTIVDSPKTNILKQNEEDWIKTQIQTAIHQSQKTKKISFLGSKSFLFMLFSFTALASMIFLLWRNPTPEQLDAKALVNSSETQMPLEDLSKEKIIITEDNSENKKPLEEEKPKPQKWLAQLKITTLPKESEIDFILDEQKQTTKSQLIKTFEITDRSLKIPIVVKANGFYEEKFDVIFDKENLNFEKEIALKPVEYGKIYLYSRPWATFRIKDFDDKSYPSASTIEMPVGDYNISVYSPSQKRSAGRKITIKKEQTLSCLASFASRSTISCRYK